MSDYLKNGRLEDVLRFVQFAGLRPTFQSDNNATTAFLGKPKSADAWITVAEEHPELFRVAGNAADRHQRPLSLLARYFLIDDSSGQTARPPMKFREVDQLLYLVLKIHERQIRNSERRKAFYAVLGAVAAALIAGLFTLATKR